MFRLALSSIFMCFAYPLVSVYLPFPKTILVVAQSGVRSGTAGSLVVRSVFQPFEESTFTSFAKAVSGAGDGLSFILSMTPMFHSACSPLSFGWPLFHVIHETWEFCSWVF
jgi:hypothetical protein